MNVDGRFMHRAIPSASRLQRQRSRKGMKDDLMRHLRRCVELAVEALEAGDEPFGSILVDGDGKVLAEARNRVGQGDRTRHPEFELARWAAENMSPEEREKATVFTSGEHCPMCAAAHAWAGLGRIVYATSARQMVGWFEDLGAPASPVRPLSIQEIAPGVAVEGPVPEFSDEIHALHRRYHGAPGKPR